MNAIHQRPPRVRTLWRGIPLLVALLVAALATVLPTSSAAAAELVATELTATSPGGTVGSEVPVTVLLRELDGDPVGGAQVVLDRTLDGEPVRADVITDSAGEATVDVALSALAAENVVEISFAGTAAHAASQATHRLDLVPVEAPIELRAPTGVVQGHSATFTASWTLPNGTALAGVRLQLQRRTTTGWQSVRSGVTSATGSARITLMPRGSASYRIAARRTEVAQSPASASVTVRLRPIIAAVRLPEGAPEPRVKLPPQALAFSSGARPVVTRIPDAVWRSMVGRSWHRGCMSRSSLRLIRISYWDYQGFRRRGELVAATGVAPKMVAAFSALYRAKLPVRSMYRVDRFGWSKRLQGADDYASMAAGNTSAFNCRNVVGRPGVKSPHARGRSVDLNPWENPFASRGNGWVPNKWWVSRCHPTVSWCNSSHRVVRTLRAHGLRWTYGTSDRHHFDG